MYLRALKHEVNPAFPPQTYLNIGIPYSCDWIYAKLASSILYPKSINTLVAGSIRILNSAKV
jgi:hypothetical protein